MTGADALTTAAFSAGARTRELTLGGKEFLDTQQFTDKVIAQL